MANHPSALKRIRQSEVKTLHNRYYAKTMRNAVRKFRLLTDKKEATDSLPKLYEMIDRLAKKGSFTRIKQGISNQDVLYMQTNCNRAIKNNLSPGEFSSGLFLFIFIAPKTQKCHEG